MLYSISQTYSSSKVIVLRLDEKLIIKIYIKDSKPVINVIFFCRKSKPNTIFKKYCLVIANTTYLAIITTSLDKSNSTLLSAKFSSKKKN